MAPKGARLVGTPQPLRAGWSGLQARLKSVSDPLGSGVIAEWPPEVKSEVNL